MHQYFQTAIQEMPKVTVVTAYDALHLTES
jgi:hypothetical protein